LVEEKSKRDEERRRAGDRYMDCEMRRVMRKRYVPTSYSRTMRKKLQRLS